jgi:integrase/recombinase XerD
LKGVKLQRPVITKLKIQEKPKTLISPEVRERIYQASSDYVKLFISIMRFSGCRPSEALRLRGKHIVGENFVFEKTKNGKVRLVPIHPVLKNMLPNVGPEDHLITYRGCPIEANGIRKAITKTCKRIGIENQVTPYAFRHTFATGLLDKTDIYTIQQILGHADIKTTQIYLHYSQKRAREAIEGIQ